MAYSRKEAISYVEDIPVKIGEHFRPPRQVLLPLDFELMCIPTGLLDEEYDFSLERQVLEEYRKKIERSKSTDDYNRSEASDNQDEETMSPMQPDDSQKNPGNHLIASMQSGTILQPQLLTKESHNTENNQEERQKSFNPADFESEVASPFDYIELQTLNDLEELSNVFQGISEQVTANKDTQHKDANNPSPTNETASSSESDKVQNNDTPEISDETVPETCDDANNSAGDAQTGDNSDNTNVGSDAVANDNEKPTICVDPTNISGLNGISHSASWNRNKTHNDAYSFMEDLQDFPRLRSAKSASDLRNATEKTDGFPLPARAKTPPPYSSDDQDVLSSKSDSEPPSINYFGSNLPQAVVFSITQRISGKEATSCKTVAPSLPDPYSDLSEEDQQFVDSLTDMGFPRDRVSRAVKYLGPDDKKVVDYLCQVQSLEESGYDSNEAETALVLNDHRIEEARTFLNMMNQFSDLGFEREAVKRALVKHKNDRDKALDVLLSSS